MSLLSQASLVLTPNAIAEDKLYSIIPSNGNGDMAVTRATTATRVNSEGFIEEVPYNLVKYSEMFTDASWAKSNTSITANVINAPNGTLTADLVSRSSTTLGCQVAQLYLSTKSNTYTGVIYAKLGTISTNFGLRILGVYPDRGDALFNLSTGTLIGVSNGGTNTGTSATITNVGNGWFKLSITTNFPVISTGLQLQFGATALNSINAWEGADGVLSNAYIWGAQLTQGSIPKDYFPTTDRLNVPRLNYDVAGGCPSILLEPQRTNLYEYSQDFNQANWTLSNVTLVNASNVNPINGNTSFLVSETAVIQFHNVLESLNSFTSGISYTASLFVKKGTGITAPDIIQLTLSNTAFGTAQYANFNINTGVVTFSTGGTATIVPYLNGWYRISWTAMCLTTATGVAQLLFCFCNNNPTSLRSVSYLGSITSNVFIFGAQLEQGAYPTSYIPTLASTVTRNADVISRNNIYTNGLITSAGGTWFVELNNNFSLIREGSNRNLYLGDSLSGSGNGFSVINPSSSGTPARLSIFKLISSVSSALFTTTTDTVKLAIKWNGSTADVFTNGVKVASATSFPTTVMEFLLNTNGGSQTSLLKSMLLFPTPLSDSECIQLTTI